VGREEEEERSESDGGRAEVYASEESLTTPI